MARLIPTALVLALTAALARADLVISANDNKLDLSTGERVVVPNAGPDTVTILDFAVFPPRVENLEGIRNSVIGPPGNVAITPDESLALIASSLKLDPTDPSGQAPDNLVHVLDLTTQPPQVVGEVTAGKQPSGLSIAPSGKLALVANRADGTVSVLAIRGKKVELVGTVELGKPESEVSHVAISPDGKLALVSMNAEYTVRVLRIEGEHVEATDRLMPVYGKPYHCEFTPDGALAIVAGGGGLKGPDADALTVIDMRVEPIRTIDHITVAPGPESFDISPDGRLVAAVLMNGSNLAADDPVRTEHGSLVLLERREKEFTKVQELPIGRIPEGVTFTPDGRYLVVQHHPARELAIFEVNGNRLKDTGERIPVPGMPSGLRGAERPLQ